MKILRAKNWSFVEQKSDLGSSPEFSVVISDPEISSKATQVRVPYASVMDTTISPDTHDLYIEYEKSKGNTFVSLKNNVFFRKRSITDEGGAASRSNFPNSPIGSLGKPIPAKRKAIIDDVSGTAVTVSEGGAAIGPPGRETIIGPDGMTVMSGSPRIPDLPSEDHLLFKETGLGRLMPRCFVPPFCMPAFLPNLQFLAQVAGTIAVFKQIASATKRTF